MATPPPFKLFSGGKSINAPLTSSTANDFHEYLSQDTGSFLPVESTQFAITLAALRTRLIINQYLMVITFMMSRTAWVILTFRRLHSQTLSTASGNHVIK